MIPPPSAARAVGFGEALAVLTQVEAGPLESAETFRRSLGGAEANVMIGLSAQGVRASLLSRVGDDGFGRYIAAHLGRLGVDASACEVDPVRPTGLYVKEVGLDGSRMHYYRAGSAASALAPEMFDAPAVAAVLSDAALVHTTGITPALSGSALLAQRELVRRVRGRAIVSFDLNWRPALWRGREQEGREVLAGFLRSSDIALLGLDEAEAVFGLASADAVRARFPEPARLVVKDGAGAVVGFDGDDRVEVAAQRVAVVEAIGAGDAFASGLLAAVLQGAALADGIRAGHEAAARALRTTGDHIGDAGADGEAAP